VIAERPTVPDQELVDSWVERRFLQLGFTPDQARDLRQAGADWHEAERLLDRGCTHQLATTILT
jgi:hypothetical protein